MPGTLFLVPTPIADIDVAVALPASALPIIFGIDYFLAENAKSTRAFLKRAGHPQPLRELHIVEIGHTPDDARLGEWLAPIAAGKDGAIVSEAGCPGIADPGASLVAAAHELRIQVRPLVGPSSIVLAVMGSGLNGQRFRFLGYLPIPAAERAARITGIERESKGGETQVFIETPYRSDSLLGALLENCASSTRIAVAADLTGPGEYIRMQTVAAWRAGKERPLLGRRPTVFCLLA